MQQFNLCTKFPSPHSPILNPNHLPSPSNARLQRAAYEICARIPRFRMDPLGELPHKMFAFANTCSPRTSRKHLICLMHFAVPMATISQYSLSQCVECVLFHLNKYYMLSISLSVRLEKQLRERVFFDHQDTKPTNQKTDF